MNSDRIRQARRQELAALDQIETVVSRIRVHEAAIATLSVELAAARREYRRAIDIYRLAGRDERDERMRQGGRG